MAETAGAVGERLPHRYASQLRLEALESRPEVGKRIVQEDECRIESRQAGGLEELLRGCCAPVAELPLLIAEAALEPSALAWGAVAGHSPGETAASVVVGEVPEVLRAGGGRVRPDVRKGKTEQRDRAR